MKRDHSVVVGAILACMFAAESASWAQQQQDSSKSDTSEVDDAEPSTDAPPPEAGAQSAQVDPAGTETDGEAGPAVAPTAPTPSPAVAITEPAAKESPPSVAASPPDANTTAGARSDWAPTFALLEHVGRGNFGVLDASLIVIPDAELFGTRANAYVQRSVGRLGFYAQFSGMFGTSGTEGHTTFGNFEGGLLVTGKLENWASGVLRAGITAPSDQDNSGVGLVGLFSRPSDFVLFLPETSALRWSAAGQIVQQQLFMRAEAGVDVLLNTPEGAEEIEPLVHLGLAAGYRSASGLGYGLELHTLVPTNEGVEGLTSVGLTLVNRGGTRASLVLPLDAVGRGEVWMLTIGTKIGG